MGLEDLDPLRDFDSTGFSDLLEGETLEDIAANEALRYWPGKLKAIARGGSVGLLIGGALGYAADFPADQGATYGMLLFGAADAALYDHRYVLRCAREAFGKGPLRTIGTCVADYFREKLNPE